MSIGLRISAWFFLLNFWVIEALYAQKIPIKAPQYEVDSTYLDVQSDSWSFRILAQYKLQGVTLVNKENGERFGYKPINPYGIGIGISYRYLILDFSVNLRTDEREPLSRFDLSGSLYLKNSLIDFFIQRYNGFTLRNSDIQRDDMNTTMIGMNWYHNINAQRINLGSVFTGNSIVKKNASSWGVGAYFSLYQLKADSSIVPESEAPLFNNFAGVNQTRFANVGFLTGFTQSVALPDNFFTVLGIYPGIGLNIGEITTETLSYDAGLLSGKINLRAAIGISNRKRYIVLSGSMDNFLIDIGNSNRYRYTSGKIKLVYGFRFKSRIKQIDKILQE